MLSSRLLFLVGLAFLISCGGRTNVAALEQRNERDTASAEGEAFEMEAIRAFWGDAAFMRECAPPQAATADSVTIYFEVRTDGSLGELLITPDTPVGRCIAAAVEDRQFPPTG